jgi:1-acyl-sn-glycerol-3-phosphate acyltransferase
MRLSGQEYVDIYASKAKELAKAERAEADKAQGEKAAAGKSAA